MLCVVCFLYLVINSKLIAFFFRKKVKVRRVIIINSKFEIKLITHIYYNTFFGIFYMSGGKGNLVQRTIDYVYKLPQLVATPFTTLTITIQYKCNRSKKKFL